MTLRSGNHQTQVCYLNKEQTLLVRDLSVLKYALEMRIILITLLAFRTHEAHHAHRAGKSSRSLKRVMLQCPSSRTMRLP